MNKLLYISDSNDVHVNIAREAYLINKIDPSSYVLYLWKNNPCVVIGRYQNPWSECNLQSMRQDGIVLQRRKSGGGAVYHNLGNVCFTFVSPRNDFSVERNFNVVCQALQSLGFNAQVSGRNDLTVDGYKVSGNAFQHTSNRSSHHGTMLLQTSVDEVAKYLSPNKLKLKSHAVASVSSRVKSLGIETDLFIKAMVDAFGECTQLDECQMDDYELFSSDEWNYGKTPSFTVSYDARLSDCCVTYDLNISDGIIINADIWTDSLDTEWVQRTSLVLKGVKYSVNSIVQLSNLVKDNKTASEAILKLSEII